jgi:uncharacterized RDD family membrane protein YckC
MKCPKCNYLGFETGDRCKNCGYDFSFIVATIETPEGDMIDVTMPRDEGTTPDLDLTLPGDTAAPADAVAPHRVPELPLFGSAVQDDNDEPLIRVPGAPRPPLAVRKTPEAAPRLRAVPKPAPAEAALEFADDEAEAAPVAAERPIDAPPPFPERPRPGVPDVSEPPMADVGRVDTPRLTTSAPLPRLAAAAIDHVILIAIDLAVVYFTLRMTGLTMSDWPALPVAPLVTFLLLLKVAYFMAFTAVGGQTIGKMATHIRVVTESLGPLDPATAARRTAVATASTIVFGLGFIPALFAADRRALHDRVAHTRVVALHSA